ncbi:MAG: tRNA epoxyqueuosine(34) reductase QueG [Ignavibacteria bacterium]|jgi:epoxyqueuosine reductase
MKLTNELVERIAREIGFDIIGFAPADLLTEETEFSKQWLGNKYHAGMKYMEKNWEKRFDVSKILPGAKSVISLALNYNTNHKHSGDELKGKVSRYAWGRDYHLIIREMLEEFENELKKYKPDLISKSYVDTGPVMDKAWAVKAAIGWMGKHSNVINRDYGSWFFIANIITNQEFEYTPTIPDYCGSCTACIDACPTDAIVKDYFVDSNKCISYLTIENKGEISNEFKNKFEGWIFGCDICQDVCPWNTSFSKLTSIGDFNPVNENMEINLTEILEMNNSEFKNRFKESPISRAKLRGLKRNAEFLND